MLNARVLSYRDLEAFLARGEETGPPILFQRPFSAEEIAEHWQAIWQAKVLGRGHDLHHQDDEDGDPSIGLDTIREAALAITLISHGCPDDVITPQAHHDEPPTRNFTRVRRTVYGVVIAIAAWWTSRAQQDPHASWFVNPDDLISSEHGDCDANQPAADDAEDTFEVEDDAEDHAGQHQVLRRDAWISRAPHRREGWQR